KEWTLSTAVEKDNFGNVVLRPGEVGEAVAHAIEQKTGLETRAIALGHLQRGGAPCAYDRILGTRYGVKAAEAVIAENFGHMVVAHGQDVSTRPMAALVRES